MTNSYVPNIGKLKLQIDKLKRKDIENLNRPINRIEMESMKNNLLTRKTPELDDLTVELQ